MYAKKQQQCKSLTAIYIYLFPQISTAIAIALRHVSKQQVFLTVVQQLILSDLKQIHNFPTKFYSQTVYPYCKQNSSTSNMHFPVNGTRYVISYNGAFADNFTNKKPACDFNGDQCIDSSFLQHKSFSL